MQFKFMAERTTKLQIKSVQMQKKMKVFMRSLKITRLVYKHD